MAPLISSIVSPEQNGETVTRSIAVANRAVPLDSTARRTSRSSTAIATTLLAPFGARMAHRWPVARLRGAFATMLFVLGAYMLWKATRY